MVRSRLQLILLSLALLISANAGAQIDPASGLLLGPGASQDVPSRENGLDSGRYTTRPKTTTATRRKASSATQSTTVTVETKTETGPSAKVAKTATLPSVLVDVPDEPTSGRTPSVPAQAAVPVVVTTPVPVVVLAPSPSPTPLVIQAPPSVAIPAATPVVSAYVPKPDPIDRRWDLVDINIAPGYFIQDSKSAYTYRNYQFTAPGISISADAWIWQAFGFHAKFFSSLGGSLKDSFDGSQNVWAAQQNLEIGARWRHQTGDDTQSPTLFFGIDWDDEQMKVPSDSMLRQHLRTDGLNISGGFEIPTSENYAWTADLSMMPFADQTERSSAFSVSSGSHADTSAIALGLGGRYAFDHTSSIYWKVSGRLQKDVYQGQANPADPVTGQTLSGVTITTKSVLLELGFSFGN